MADEIKDWRDGLSDEVKANKDVFDHAGQFKSLDEAVKSLFEQKQEVSRRLPIPADDWDDKRWENFGARLRPKDKAAYKVTIPDDMKPYILQERVDTIIEACHKRGVPVRWANELIQMDVDNAAVQARAILKKQSDDIKTVELEAERIKAEDDKAFNESCIKSNLKVEDALALSSRGWAKMAEMIGAKPEDLTKLMDVLGIRTHTIFRNIGMKLGETFADASPVGGAGTSSKKKEESKPVGVTVTHPKTSEALGWNAEEPKK